MPFQVGDVVKVVAGFLLPNQVTSDGNFTTIIKCVHDNGRYHLFHQNELPSTNQGERCTSGPFCWVAEDIYLQLVATSIPPQPCPFRVGDRVRQRGRGMDTGFTVADIQHDFVNARGLNGEFIFITVLWSHIGRSSGGASGITVGDAELVPNYKPGEVSKPVKNAKFTIGSDIECSFVCKNSQVTSSSVMTERFRETAYFGTDHGNSVGEFRPQYASDPRAHCFNLKRAIRKIVEGGYMLPDTKLDSSHIIGSHVVGGHIHFGIKDLEMQDKIRKNLDYWLLPTIQPLFPKEVFMKRVGSGYGRLQGEAVRQQNHGFEYRLIPSFIFSEKIAMGIFCLAYVIAKLTMEGTLKVRIEEQDSSWMKKFMDDYNNYGLNNLNDLREESIKKLLDKNLLGDLSEYIYPLFDAIRNEEKFSGDIAEGWGMKYKYVLNSRDKVSAVVSEIRDRTWWRDRVIFADGPAATGQAIRITPPDSERGMERQV